MTKKQANDIEVIKYFTPECLLRVKITHEDEIKFLEYSDKGLHKDDVKGSALKADEWDGFNVLCESKRWRGIHVHELYEPGIIDGTMPYFTILGGYDIVILRKWWQFWKPKYRCVHNPVPRNVVDFLKKEMFRGQDSDTIERCYQSILEEYEQQKTN